jgi:hypothetical protein
LTVTADLIKRGFQVFRATTKACGASLVFPLAGGEGANDRWMRVKVRAGYDSAKGPIPFNRPVQTTFDVLAVVSSIGITYLPPLESLTQSTAS